MSSLRGRAGPALLIALVLFAGATLGSYAANGGPLLLGKSNSASKTTTLKTTGNGAALKLKSKPGKAGLKVSNTAKVTKFNADLVDGLDGSMLQNKTYHFDLAGTSDMGYISFPITTVPNGIYLVTFDVTMDVSGGSPTSTACFADHVGPAVAKVSGDYDGTMWLMSGAGVLDASTGDIWLVCQRLGGGTVTNIPSVGGSAHVTFTRLDQVIEGSVTGEPGFRGTPGLRGTEQTGGR